MNEVTRNEITEKVHGIMDILRENPDMVLSHHCERMLDRLDVLAALASGHEE